MAKPTQSDPQFKLRMTPELHGKISEAARANNRSMNAEILDRLEKSAQVEAEALSKNLEKTIVHAIFETLEILSENGLKQRILGQEERQKLELEALNRIPDHKTG